MKRRDTIKTILLGGVAGGLALNGCKTDFDPKEMAKAVENGYRYPGRTEQEQAYIDKLEAEEFFNAHELSTMTILCDLILPANENGGTKEADCVGLIEFMAKDWPPFQTPLRGGFMWLDHKSNTDFGKEFKALSEAQQKEILDQIAFNREGVEEQPLEVKFFALMRNLTLTGYYTSEVGIKDLGYKGNRANVWDGVPEEVLADHDVDYEPEWLAKCIDQSKRGEIAQWDADGNLLT